MKRKNALAVFLLVVLTISLIILAKNLKPNQVCFKNYCFLVELAKTEQERNQGLMFKKSLDSDKGMFFVYEKEGIYSFWMENTLIPLDIIWINQNKEVVFINENSQPYQDNSPCPLINPLKNARYVLEINSGMAEKIGLKIGDKINF